ncbi:Translation initiation factor IF-2 [Clarias magur]|uniref:Translation initiation factor IF-2 n=1 Tax=Clarias magur TaxID=1594786 RepID=A0A8J4WYC6_CLAMG|nr:Translation initiation factor IF-2 [Clarias magur]
MSYSHQRLEHWLPQKKQQKGNKAASHAQFQLMAEVVAPSVKHIPEANRVASPVTRENKPVQTNRPQMRQSTRLGEDVAAVVGDWTEQKMEKGRGENSDRD